METLSPTDITAQRAAAAAANFHHELQRSRVYARTRRQSSGGSIMGSSNLIRRRTSSWSGQHDTTSDISSTLLNSRNSVSTGGDTVVQSLRWRDDSSESTSIMALLDSRHLRALYSTNRRHGGNATAGLTSPSAIAATATNNQSSATGAATAHRRGADRTGHHDNEPFSAQRASPRPTLPQSHPLANFDFPPFPPLPRPRPRPLLPPTTGVVDDRHARHALLQACHSGHSFDVEQLLISGVDPNARERHSLHSHPHHPSPADCPAAIHVATMRGHHEVVRALLRYGARVNEPFRAGRSALHEAVRIGDTALTILLLDNGAGVRARDDAGHTPLHFACMRGRAPCARLLVWAGAAVDARGDDELTPLHHVAMANGDVSIVELLVGQGADVRAKTRWLLGCKTAREIAKDKEFVDMERALAEIEARLELGVTVPAGEGESGQAEGDEGRENDREAVAGGTEEHDDEDPSARGEGV